MTREKSPIRVLLVGPVPPPYGGIATYVKDLWQAEIEDVEMALFNTAFPTSVAPVDRVGSLYRDSVARNGLWVTIKMILHVLWSYPRLAYRLLRDRPEIVQAFPSSHWSYWRNWLYLLLSRALGCRTIFHLLNAIDLFYGRVGRFQRWLLRMSFRTSDAYIVQSEGLKAWLMQYCPQPCYGFLNGLHLDRIPPAEKAGTVAPYLPEPIGLTIGGLGKHKGTPQILDAIRRLHDTGLEVGWIFVGMGDVDFYAQRANALGIDTHVHFTGAAAEAVKWDCLYRADFYCLPSDGEGQPISILEAMVAGLPVIATSVGSIPEIIAEGETGHIIPVANEAALDGAIRKMIQEAQRRREMGAKAREYALQAHSIARLFHQMGEVYQDLQAGHL